MKGKIRKITALILAAVMMLSFTACSKSGDSGKDNPSTATVTPMPTDAPTPEPTKAQEATPTPTAAPTPEPTATPTPEPEPVITEAPQAEKPDFPASDAISIIIRPVNDRRYDDEYNEIARYKYDYPLVDDDFSEDYEALVQAFENYRFEAEGAAAEGIDYLVEARSGDGSDWEYYKTGSLKTLRADVNAVSFEYNWTEYTGGMREYSGYSGLTVDPVTGNGLYISDIISDRDAFLDQLYAELEQDENVDASNFEAFKELIANQYDEGSLNYALGYDHLAVIFDVVDMAQFIYDDLIIRLSFDQYWTLFNEKYLSVPENWIVYMSDVYDYSFDIDQDGIIDNFRFSFSDYNDWGDFGSISFLINGEPAGTVFDITENCYEAEPYLIHFGNENYLYITYWYDSEDSMTCIYRIDMGAGNVELVQNQFGWIMSDHINCDPAYFYMMSRCDIIGTNYVEAYFTVDEEGLPLLQSSRYTFVDQYDITLNKDAVFERYFYATDSYDADVTLSAGQSLRFNQTDGESFVDFYTTEEAEGHPEYYYRLDVNTVDDINELFSGLRYYD